MLEITRGDAAGSWPASLPAARLEHRRTWRGAIAARCPRRWRALLLLATHLPVLLGRHVFGERIKVQRDRVGVGVAIRKVIGPVLFPDFFSLFVLGELFTFALLQP